MYSKYLLVDSVVPRIAAGLNSVSLVKRKVVVLSCVASRQPMDSDPFITSME